MKNGVEMSFLKFLFGGWENSKSERKINQRDEEGRTAFMRAVSNFDYAEIDRLFHQGADINMLNEEGEPILIELFKKRAPLCWKKPDGLSEENEIRIDELDKMIIYLVNLGIDVSLKDRFGWTPLLYAIEQRQIELVKLLIDRGANPKDRTKQDETPLHRACYSGDKDIVCFLCEKGVDIDALNQRGQTPLMLALQARNMEIVSFLLDRGAGIFFKDNEGCGIIEYFEKGYYLLRETEQLKCLRLLCQKGVDLNAQDQNGETILMRQIGKKNWKIVNLLLKYNPDVNVQDNCGCTALMRAVEGENIKLVHRLLRNGADVCLKDNLGGTAFNLAVRMGNLSIVQEIYAKMEEKQVKMAPDILFDFLCNISISSLTKDHIKDKKFIPLLDWLYQKGVPLDYQSQFGETLLMECVKRNSRVLVEALCQRGVDLNLQDQNGQTALMHAVFNQNPDLVRCLLEFGANVFIRDKNGKNALELAQRKRNKEIINLLRGEKYTSQFLSQMTYRQLIDGKNSENLFKTLKGLDILGRVFECEQIDTYEKLKSVYSNITKYGPKEIQQERFQKQLKNSFISKQIQLSRLKSQQ